MNIALYLNQLQLDHFSYPVASVFNKQLDSINITTINQRIKNNTSYYIILKIKPTQNLIKFSY